MTEVLHPSHDDRPERSTHRLEAFSDIVIGFSLAQLGLTLVIPPHAIEFVTRPAGIFAFIVSFVIVGRFWWVNFLVFEHYFRPNRIMVTFSFIALGSLLLQIFALQLYLHFAPLQDGAVASRIYFALFSLSYGTQGIMLALGLHYHWRTLSPQFRRAGVRVLFGRFGVVVGSVLGNLLATNDLAKIYTEVGAQSTLVANLPTSVLVGTAIGVIVGVLASWCLPGLFRSLNAT
ncbi:MAG TPA: TMEM175 family protein [Candidatus Tumulicola sp.]